MAIGVGTANAILLVTFADQHRKAGTSAFDSAMEGVKERMRPILMTSAAMIAGMIPMALATEVTAPLGRAVTGGLIAATLANLTVLPFLFSIVSTEPRPGLRRSTPTIRRVCTPNTESNNRSFPARFLVKR